MSESNACQMNASSLNYLLIGLLLPGSCTGYDLRKQIADSPLRIYSDSPGAIYPALRRLSQWGWVEAGPAHGPRGRRALTVTSEGQQAFVDWLRRPVERADVEGSADELLLRFAFMGTVLDQSEIQAFLEDFECETRAHLDSLRDYQAAEGKALPTTGRLAFEFGLADFEARIRWARMARRELETGRPVTGQEKTSETK
jgi:DNA-binding PadR family transcriptional regulator